MDNSALEALLSNYNWWMGLSTIAVAVGILGEYVAHFVLERDAKRNRIEMIFGILFGVLVLGGVVGEYMFGSKLSDVAGQLQRKADGEVATLTKSAADATKDAAKASREAGEANLAAASADERSKGLEHDNLILRTDLNKAAGEVAKLKTDAAEARRKQAEAEERLAKVRKRQEPRGVNIPAFRNAMNGVSSPPPGKVFIKYAEDSPFNNGRMWGR